MIKLDDIAKLANVSKAAASLALNGKPGVSEETRALILKIAKDYNYIPLRAPKNKKITPQNRTFHFLFCKTEDIKMDDYKNMPFFNELINYMTSEAQKYSFSLLISSIDEINIDKDLESLHEKQDADGIFLLGTNLSIQTIKKITNIQPKTVILDTCYLESNNDFVAINNFQGAYIGAEYLIKMGHKKIAYAKSKQRIYNFKERRQGFEKALKSHNLSLDSNNIFELPGMKIEACPEIAVQIKEKKHDFTAIFCENDYIAISLMKSCTTIGIKIPEDISLIGFDNISESKIIYPELSTIFVDKKKIVQLALQRMSDKINDRPTECNIQSFVNTFLVPRNSVKNITLYDEF